MTKPTKWPVRPAKTQISLGIRPVWSESSLSAWRKLGSLATHWAHSEDSDQTGRIWVFAGRTVILLVLSWGVSYMFFPVFDSIVSLKITITDRACNLFGAPIPMFIQATIERVEGGARERIR